MFEIVIRMTMTFSGICLIQDYESEEKFSIPDDRISHLLPSSYQDMIVRVYSKKPKLVCLVIATAI